MCPSYSHFLSLSQKYISIDMKWANYGYAFISRSEFILALFSYVVSDLL